MYQGPVAPVVKSLTPKDSEADGALPSATAILSATSRHACASLRLIATSDLHASLMPYDYCADRPNSSLGLDAIALQIAEARGEARNCLLFDNGDFLQGSLFELPLPDRSFDLVIAVRLISHVEDWPRLVAEMCRVARRAVVIDYPSKSALNALTPLLFGLKKSLEGNTRTYASFTRDELCEVFQQHGFRYRSETKQFLLPMVAHRAFKGAAPLRWAESAFKASRLTAVAGSPSILRMDRSA